ncbi:MAG: cobyrinate a,c-diamide synthase [Firmicutes bacterium]|nr:cobyrinate a,c-diamide synthase [Bacillota bacterium]
MSRGRILFSAPSSGSGKTMIVCGILQALHDRGISISSFKCGPDYIDPMFHEKVIGVRSANLDLFFTGEDQLRRIFARNAEGTEISVIEGVMGYYDGMAADSADASSYHVSRVLECPSVLIVDARGQSLSALASLKGFLDFREGSNIKGVIFNRMPEKIFLALKDEIEKLGVKALGYVPVAKDMVIESRHLGLVTPGEIKDMSERLHSFAGLLEKTLDMDGIISLACSAPAMDVSAEKREYEKIPVRIALADDEAFCFMYKDNLAILREMGAELVSFSPIHDEKLPEGVQGLILYGGYPELYAKELSENLSMRESIRAAIEGGMPCLAECGGFMYLHEEMEDMNGVFYPMCGIIKAKTWKTPRLGRFGYITLHAEEDSAFLKKGDTLKAHEFHYFESGDCGEALRAVKPNGSREWRAEHTRGNLLAGFPHLYYESDPGLVQRFLEKCAERK